MTSTAEPADVRTATTEPPTAHQGGRWWRQPPLGTTAAVLTVVLGASIVIAVTIGPVHIPAGDVLRTIAGHLGIGSVDPSPRLDGIVWDLRLPRIFVSAACGIGLAGVGVVMQGVTRNPLADPYLLGLSSGASLGTVVMVAFFGLTVGSPLVAVTAFGGAALAFAFVLAIASVNGRLPTTRTLLAGIAVGELCAAATSFITISSTNAQATRSVLVWLLGGFSGTDWTDVRIVFAALVVFAVAVRWEARTLDALAMGDETALSLGIDAHRSRRRLLLLSALLTGVLVATCGAIGFVGLVIPHMVRPFMGARHARVLPIAMLVGGIFLVWVDTVARTAFAPEEIPVGVLTALVGAPFFAWQIKRQGSEPS